MNRKKFNEWSYAEHANSFNEYARGGDKEGLAKTWFETDTAGAWRFERMYHALDPLLAAYPDAKWLTIGDGRYGRDARYIQEKGLDVLATDISDVLLKEALAIDYINKYRRENAESLSFKDGEFDFIFCKEAYHHFPRPMLALYEMLRVAEKAVVLIEPNDACMVSTLREVCFRKFINLVRRLTGTVLPEHNFEESGNYVYTTSRREIKKAALGINLKTVAFKGLNDHYIEGSEYEKAADNGKLFKKIRRRIGFLDLLTRLKLWQPNLLVAVIFKGECGQDCRGLLSEHGYEIADLPDNPHFQP